jgi:selenocysteine lyase/cysteine desulfurase
MGTVRFSLSYFNNEEEIEKTLHAVGHIAKE